MRAVRLAAVFRPVRESFAGDSSSMETPSNRSAAALHPFGQKAISTYLEMGAYEELWLRQRQTFRGLARLFEGSGGAPPSSHVEHDVAWQRSEQAAAMLAAAGIDDARFVVHGTMDYPQQLRDAAHPVQLLYCRGDLSLMSAPRRVSIIGSRQASERGILRARRLARMLAADRAVVVSGLARGIDTAAHEAAIEAGGRTIAVPGTPISSSYPPENRALQEEIARNHLLASQVPVLRHSRQGSRENRRFFPERNITMAALAHASVIVEAGETSGSLIQARAALEQGRRLFVLASCFGRGLKWPERFERQGAVRVSGYEDISGSLAGLDAGSG